MSRSFWQHPFVNVVKHASSSSKLQIGTEGDVSVVQDKSIGRTVYRIVGSIPANNYVKIPRLSQSLALTGRFAYIPLKVFPTKVFSFTLEVITTEELSLRISFSNIYKTEKISDSTIQLPLRLLHEKWVIFAVDFKTIVEKAKKKFRLLKSVQFCSNMLMRNVITSDNHYGFRSFPREHNFLCRESDNWEDMYEWIWFPGYPDDLEECSPAKPATRDTPQRVSSAGKPSSLSKKTDSSVAFTRVLEGISKSQEKTTGRGRGGRISGGRGENLTFSSAISTIEEEEDTVLKPDPIVELRQVMDVSDRRRLVAWGIDDSEVVFASQNRIVAMDVNSRSQRFFFGHTANISSFALDKHMNILASAQEGKNPQIRLWDYATGRILTILKHHAFDITCLSFSEEGNYLASVGRDPHGRQQIVVWNVSDVRKSGKADPLIRQSTDHDIERLIFCPFDHRKMVSCGKRNIRLYRIRDQELRGGSVILPPAYQNVDFTDIAFDVGDGRPRSEGRVLYCSTFDGKLYKIDYDMRKLLCVYQLHDTCINSVYVKEGMCVTGSDDKFVRLWPLDFTDFFLEAEHEGKIMSVSCSNDGLRVIVGSSNGSVGFLDVSTQKYQTIMRSHAKPVLDMACDPFHREFTTVCGDSSVRVWDLDTYDQLYQFDTVGEHPLCVAYHPQEYIIYCGFSTGVIRVFDIESTTLLDEFQCHRNPVKAIKCAPDGRWILSASVDAIAISDAEHSYDTIRVLRNVCPAGAESISLSANGHYLAAIASDPQYVVVYSTSMWDIKQKLDVGSRAIDIFVAGNRKLYALTESGQISIFDLDDPERNVQLISDISNAAGMTFLNNGRLCVTGHEDGTIRVWDAMNLGKSRCPVQTFGGHHGTCAHISASGDGCDIISGGDQGAVFIWKFLGTEDLSDILEDLAVAERDEIVRKGKKDPSSPGSPIPSWEEVIARGEAERAAQDEIDDAQVVQTVPHDHAPFRKCFVATVEDTIPKHIHTPPEGKSRIKLSHFTGYGANGHDNLIWMEGKGKIVYSCGSLLVVEDLITGEQSIIRNPHGEISGLAYYAPSDLLAVATGSAVSDAPSPVALFDMGHQNCLSVLRYHTGGIQSMSFSCDGRKLVTCGMLDQSVVVWNVLGGVSIATATAPSRIVEIVCDPSSEKEFASVGDGTLSMWYLEDDQLMVHVIPAHSMPVSCQEKMLTSLSYTPDGKHLFFSTNDGVVGALETESNTPVGSWVLGLGEIDFIRARRLSLLIVGDGELVWSFGYKDGSLLEQSSFVRVDGNARAVCVDEHDEDKVLVSTDAGTMWACTFSNSEATRLVSSHSSDVNRAVFAPGDVFFGTIGEDRTLRIWNTPQCHQIVQFAVKDATCVDVDFGAGGKDCFAAFSDQCVRLYDLMSENAQMENAVSLHGDIMCIKRIHGKSVCCGMKNGSLLLVDCEFGDILAEAQVFNEPIVGMTTNLDRSKILLMYVWNL
eukprot:TRINITY_DN11910_c1_g1_i2.p1 TRINITY_DN11910_c1_g1~~TRINITY_DN11910_c1_g1_i2.p1  ORF type:complete len:1465 (+),score=373.69 TRINITY_DN11910_c1_g1_i2:109-4503(+)